MAQDRIGDDEDKTTALQDRLQYAADGNWDSLLAGLPYLAWCTEPDPHVDEEQVPRSRPRPRPGPGTEP